MNDKKKKHLEKIKPYLIGLGLYWFILLSFLLSDSIFHHIGNSVTADENPINLFTALNLLLASVVSFLIMKKERDSGKGIKSILVLWGIISAGLLFAAFDEQFEIHEAIGKNIEALIQGTSAELMFYRIFDEGEQPVMLSYFAGGIVMSVFFLKKMISSRKTAVFFISALVLQGIAALCDSFNIVTAVTGLYSENINYTGYIEEICEFTSSLMFLLAMLSEFKWIQVVRSERRNYIP